MNQEVARTTFQTKMDEIKKTHIEKTYASNREAGEKFLAENAKKEGVVTLPSGLQYKVITEGKGAIPADTSLVEVNYEGRLIDGTVFDSSYERGQSAKMRANQVIKGWTEALVHMPVGSKWELYIPQELAYGDNDRSDKIKPFSALVFTVELLGIEK
jgi:FKBP-type peptidyl-prolyl cis-trans isomerase FklB